MALVAISALCVPVVSCPSGPEVTRLNVQGGRGAVTDVYFGMHFHRVVHATRDASFTTWPSVQVGSWRLWDAGVSWPALEPAAGDWDFSRLDRCVALAESGKVELLLPLGLSPRWASSRPAEPSSYSLGNASEPRDFELWKAYVRRVAERYKGRISHYEIWNEPNFRAFFSGDVERMVRLAEGAYRVLKAVDSTIIVVSPAPAGKNGLAWFRSYLERGGGKWADVIGYHFYVAQDETPEDMSRLISDVQSIMREFNYERKPLWNTETGWLIATSQPPLGAWPKSGHPGLSRLRAVAYVARALILGWTMGIDRFYWYSWDHYTMGLVESDGRTVKPAGRAYGIVRDWLVGARVRELHSGGDGVWVAEVNRDGGHQAIVAWSHKRGQVLQVPGQWGGARRRDLLGGSRTLSRKELVHGVALDEAPILIEWVGRPQ